MVRTGSERDLGQRTKDEEREIQGRWTKDKEQERDARESGAYSLQRVCAEARETTKAKLQATGQRIMCNDVQDATWT